MTGAATRTPATTGTCCARSGDGDDADDAGFCGVIVAWGWGWGWGWGWSTVEGCVRVCAGDRGAAGVARGMAAAVCVIGTACAGGAALGGVWRGTRGVTGEGEAAAAAEGEAEGEGEGEGVEAEANKGRAALRCRRIRLSCRWRSTMLRCWAWSFRRSDSTSCCVAALATARARMRLARASSSTRLASSIPTWKGYLLWTGEGGREGGREGQLCTCMRAWVGRSTACCDRKTCVACVVLCAVWIASPQDLAAVASKQVALQQSSDPRASQLSIGGQPGEFRARVSAHLRCVLCYVGGQECVVLCCVACVAVVLVRVRVGGCWCCSAEYGTSRATAMRLTLSSVLCSCRSLSLSLSLSRSVSTTLS